MLTLHIRLLLGFLKTLDSKGQAYICCESQLVRLLSNFQTTSRADNRLLLMCSYSMNPADFDGQTSSRRQKEASSHQALWSAPVLQRAKGIKEGTDHAGGSKGQKGRAKLPVQHQVNDRMMTDEKPPNNWAFLKVTRGILFYRSHT